MSCTNRRIQLAENAWTLVCDCDECFCSQGCDSCRDDDCLAKKAERRTEELGRLLSDEVVRCYWPGCPIKATKAIVGGFDDQPKIIEICAGHAAKFVGAA